MGGRLSITEIKPEGVVGQQLYAESSYAEQDKIERIISFINGVDKSSLYFLISAENYEPTSLFLNDNRFIEPLTKNVIFRRERGQTISFVIHSDEKSQFGLSTVIHAAMAQTRVYDASYKISLAVPSGFPHVIYYRPPPFSGEEIFGDRTFYSHFPNIHRQY